MESFTRRLNHLVYLFRVQVRVIRLHFPGICLQKIHFRLFEKVKFESHSLNSLQYRVSDTLLVSKSSTTATLKSTKKLPHWKIAFFFHSTILRNNFSMEHELAVAYEESARHFGHETVFLEPESLRESHSTTKQLVDFFLKLNITHLVLLGDTRTLEHPGLTKDSLKLLRSGGVKIIVVFADLLFTDKLMGKTLIDFWAHETDVMIAHNSRILRYFPNLDNILLWPSMPFPEHKLPFEQNLNPTTDLLIPGSQHRQREVFARYAYLHGIQVSTELSNRILNTSHTFSWESYMERIRSAKLVFTNGYRNFRESQITARVTEVMLAKSVLLYEKGSDIDFFFTPYYDYIPILSLPDFFEKVNFLLNNDDIRKRISSNGFTTVSTKYSNKLFWELLANKLDR